MSIELRTQRQRKAEFFIDDNLFGELSDILCEIDNKTGLFLTPYSDFVLHKNIISILIDGLKKNNLDKNLLSFLEEVIQSEETEVLYWIGD